jgi:hypothetical protein
MAKVKIPKTLGACVDLAYTLRSARIEAQREMEARIEEMKEQEHQIRDYIINSFKKSDIEGAKGQVATVSLTRTVLPSPKDWDAIYKYIKKYDAFDLLERRVHRAAYKDRVEAGDVIPGIETFDKIDLSLTKIGGKK